MSYDITHDLERSWGLACVNEIGEEFVLGRHAIFEINLTVRKMTGCHSAVDGVLPNVATITQ